MQIAVAWDAFVGFLAGGAGPRAVVVERLAFLAISACSVVLAVTDVLAVFVFCAPRRMTIAFASSSNRKIAQTVVIAVSGRIVLRFIPERVQRIEDNPNIRRCHPVL